MTTIYRVIFRPRAKKRFDRLDPSIRSQIARKLKERQRDPRVPGDALRRFPNCYKIKVRARGIRLVYRVKDDILELLVLSIGAREGQEAYHLAAAELASLDD